MTVSDLENNTYSNSKFNKKPKNSDYRKVLEYTKVVIYKSLKPKSYSPEIRGLCLMNY